MPAADNAHTTALAPGTGTTRTPAACAAATNNVPGSLIAGVPASVISATRLPASMSSIKRGVACCSLCSCSATNLAEMPSRANNCPLCRVSSAATKSTDFNTAKARNVISPKLPIGVATTYNPGGVSSNITTAS